MKYELRGTTIETINSAGYQRVVAECQNGYENEVHQALCMQDANQQMLEALKELYKHFNEEQVGLSHESWTQELCRKAIAKAEGKESV